MRKYMYENKGPRPFIGMCKHMISRLGLGGMLSQEIFAF